MYQPDRLDFAVVTSSPPDPSSFKKIYFSLYRFLRNSVLFFDPLGARLRAADAHKMRRPPRIGRRGASATNTVYRRTALLARKIC